MLSTHFRKFPKIFLKERFFVMTNYEYFEQLIKERGISRAQVSRVTGVSSTCFSDWKSGKSAPKFDKMQRIAEYLNVPVESLMGIKKDATKEDSISIFNSLFAQLTEENQQLVLNMIRSLLGK